MRKRVKNVAVIGSTGSVGRQTLDVIRSLPGRFRVVGLAAGNNVALLEEQVREFRPPLISYLNERPSLPDIPGDFVSMEDMARHPDVDTVLVATSGKAGLPATLAAVRAGRTVCLANKETLVMAGAIVTAEARRYGAQIVPVDSEHSALWQCLEGERRAVSRLILTASGGPFRTYTLEQMRDITVAQALKHPSWQMGRKITVDSATLINKGLEVIEAHWLFNMPYDRIDVLVHPESILHSMVEFVDGAFKAQLSYPDMRLPIQYALLYPERVENATLPRLDWSRIRTLTFEVPDPEAFPGLGLAIEAGKKGGTYPAVLCGADEAGVELFLAGHIRFTDIARYLGQALEQHRPISELTLEEVFAADVWAREKVMRMAGVSC